MFFPLFKKCCCGPACFWKLKIDNGGSLDGLSVSDIACVASISVGAKKDRGKGFSILTTRELKREPENVLFLFLSS